jgi:hypothetical protein
MVGKESCGGNGGGQQKALDGMATEEQQRCLGMHR